MKNWPTVEMNLEELTPADYNPRKISKKAKEGLNSSINRFGLVQTIVWNKRTGNIVGGHQRVDVLKEQGIETADVTVVDLAEADEVALNIALNNPAIQGEWDDNIETLLTSLKADDEMFNSLQFDNLADSLNIKFDIHVVEDIEDIDTKPVVHNEEEDGELTSITDTDYPKVFVLGEHKLICVNGEHVNELRKCWAELKHGKGCDWESFTPQSN